MAEHPPPDQAFRQSLTLVGERVLAGEELRFAARELLDELALLPRADLRQRAIAERPPDTGDQQADAYRRAETGPSGLEQPLELLAADAGRLQDVEQEAGLHVPAAVDRHGDGVGDSRVAQVVGGCRVFA